MISALIWDLQFLAETADLGLHRGRCFHSGLDFAPLPRAAVRPHFDELLPLVFWPLPEPFLIDCLAEAAAAAAVEFEAEFEALQIVDSLKSVLLLELELELEWAV